LGKIPFWSPADLPIQGKQGICEASFCLAQTKRRQNENRMGAQRQKRKKPFKKAEKSLAILKILWYNVRERQKRAGKLCRILITHVSN